MPITTSLAPAKAALYREALYDTTYIRQRWLVLCGGTVYAIAYLWISFRIGASPEFAVASLGLLGVSLVLYALTYASAARLLLEINPTLFAVTFGAHVVLGAASVSQGSATRFALLFSLLGLFVVVTAPTLRSTIAALFVTAMVAVFGALVYLPGTGVSFGAIEAFSYLAPVLGLTVLAATGLENERRKAFDLRLELERRATSDDLTGVSNRAHITLLAQNEFARARRYREPFSCLMFEIDGHDAIVDRWGAQASSVVAQVFTGYCVVVMRHCDSFGRLSPSRFLALLPETRSQGAFMLAERMCRDLSAMDVVIDGETLNFTVSIGATEQHITDRAAGDLLRRAEQGLADALDRGRNIASLAAMPPSAPPTPEESAQLVKQIAGEAGYRRV